MTPVDRDTGPCKESSDGHKNVQDGAYVVGSEGCCGYLAHSILNSGLFTPAKVWAGKDRAFHSPCDSSLSHT